MGDSETSDGAHSSMKDQSELMEDKAITKNLQAQMEFLGTRKKSVEEQPLHSSQRNLSTNPSQKRSAR